MEYVCLDCGEPIPEDDVPSGWAEDDERRLCLLRCRHCARKVTQEWAWEQWVRAETTT